MPDCSLGGEIQKVVGELSELRHDVRHLEIALWNSNQLLVMAILLEHRLWSTEEDVERAFQVVEMMESVLGGSGQKGGG